MRQVNSLSSQTSGFESICNAYIQKNVVYYQINRNEIIKDIDEDRREKCYYTTRVVDLDFFISDTIKQDIVWLDNIEVDDTNQNCYEHPKEDRFKSDGTFAGLFAAGGGCTGIPLEQQQQQEQK